MFVSLKSDGLMPSFAVQKFEIKSTSLWKQWLFWALIEIVLEKNKSIAMQINRKKLSPQVCKNALVELDKYRSKTGLFNLCLKLFNK